MGRTQLSSQANETGYLFKLWTHCFHPRIMLIYLLPSPNLIRSLSFDRRTGKLLQHTHLLLWLAHINEYSCMNSILIGWWPCLSFMYVCRYDFLNPDVTPLTRLLHWHAHCVNDICFTHDGMLVSVAGVCVCVCVCVCLCGCGCGCVYVYCVWVCIRILCVCVCASRYMYCICA